MTYDTSFHAVGFWLYDIIIIVFRLMIHHYIRIWHSEYFTDFLKMSFPWVFDVAIVAISSVSANEYYIRQAMMISAIMCQKSVITETSLPRQGNIAATLGELIIIYCGKMLQKEPSPQLMKFSCKYSGDDIYIYLNITWWDLTTRSIINLFSLL